MAEPLVSLDLASAHLYLSVVELGSISKAASRHGLSQPAASQRIRKLERQVGLRLLDRSATGSMVTADGREIAQRWRPLVADAGEVDLEARALRGRRRLRATVVMTSNIAAEMLPAIGAALRSEEEPIVVEPLIRSTQDACALVREGGADLGLVDGPRQPLGLRGETLANVELVTVVAVDHPWARRRRPISVEELVASPLAVRHRGSGTRDVIEETLAASGNPLIVAPLTESDSWIDLIATVALGDGLVAIAPPLSVERAVDAGAVRIVATEVAFVQPVRLVWLGRSPSAPAARRFADAARSVGTISP